MDFGDLEVGAEFRRSRERLPARQRIPEVVREQALGSRGRGRECHNKKKG